MIVFIYIKYTCITEVRVFCWFTLVNKYLIPKLKKCLVLKVLVQNLFEIDDAVYAEVIELFAT